MNKFQYRVQGADYDVEIEELEGNVAKVLVNGIEFEVELKQPINPAHAIRKKKEVVQPAQPATQPAVHASKAAPATAQPAAAGSGFAVKAPLPGTITSVNVKVGDTVKEGYTVVVLEAMKMQNNIESEYSGTVTSISVNQGDSVMEGSVLLTIS